MSKYDLHKLSNTLEAILAEADIYGLPQLCQSAARKLNGAPGLAVIQTPAK